MAIAFTGAGRAAWTPRDTAALARAGFQKNPVVHRAVRLVAEAAASLPLTLLGRGRALDAHPLLDLLRRPNAREGGARFLESVYGHLLVSGNAYVEAVRLDEAPRELYALRPDRMRVVTGRSGWPEAYEYGIGSEAVRFSHAGEGMSPILHLTLFHPLDDVYGLPPMEAAATALDIHNAAGAWNKALLDNAARPSGALVYAGPAGQTFTEEQFAGLKAELEESYQGPLNAGRPLLLDGGLDWRALSLSPKEMDFVEAKNAAAREIALAFGVPPLLLGLPGDNTHANYAEANRAFYRQTHGLLRRFLLHIVPFRAVERRHSWNSASPSEVRSVMTLMFKADDPAAYERSTGRWSRQLASLFIHFAAVGKASNIVDVGCGTGSLTFALAEALPAARVKGLDSSQAYVIYASSRAPTDGRLVFEQGDAADLPYEDAFFDGAVSLLALNFVPNASKAARELGRVTRPGGIVAAAIWDFKGGLTYLRILADTAATLDPAGEAFRAKLFSGPFTGPDELASAWAEMGLRDVEQTTLTIRMEFSSFADYWEPETGGQGTVGAYVQSLGEEKRSLIEHYLRLAYLAGGTDGPRSFAATAWACRGVR